ncbi:MAG: hypothetical protein IPO88_22370 [Nannocystis sp.]|uniref:hypothetical protein n=1 Tax=Nannocystis sp. TaxID=1962667 RepID=UPI002423E92A|nr:hypothetical protein [Nannocystis sp.]MBK9756189.1 hypothetical protein [Nannocystis sp.]
MSDTTVYTLYPEVETDERGRYFDGQFLTAQDFVDEQRYHSDRLRRVLDLLTIAGVARGLDLAATGPWLLRLAAGTAIDDRGRLLVVPAVRDSIPVPHDLPGGAADVSLFYAEVESRVQGGSSEEEGTRGATRMREVPAIEFHAVGVAPSHAGAVLLGRIRVDTNGTITLDPPANVRVSAGLRLPAEPDGGPTLRSGGRTRPNLLQGTGDLAITGKLAVGTLDPEAALDVRGLARLDDLSLREHSLRVDGDEAKFYPIVFRDLDWNAGASVLDISRPNAQADVANAGSLIARLRWHAADGHGSDLIACEIVQTRRFIAAARPLAKEALLVVWLRGNRTYAWRANQRTELVDAKAAAKNFGGEALAPRADIDPAFDRDRVALGVTYNQIELRGPLSVAGSLAAAGDLAYTGTQSRLNAAEQPAATVRASDFVFGHSTRRGQPGRALVDYTEALTVNYGIDWPITRIGGATTEVQGDLKGLKSLTITGAAAITGNLSTAGTLSADGDATLKKALAVTGNLSTAGTLSADGDATFKKAASVGTTLTVTGDATLKKAASVATSLSVGTTLTVTGETSLKKALALEGNVTLTNDEPNLFIVRPKSATTGGTKIFLELKQEDNNPPTVPEVGVSLRFHHGNRYWHRIESRGDGFYLRDGDPASTTLRTLYAGDMFANGLKVTTGTSERLRIIRGTVTADGGISGGSGFSVSKSGSLWKIVFASAFSGEPTVIATQQYPDNNNNSDSGNTRDNAIVVGVKSGEAYIKTGDGNGDHSWRRFHFIAIGTY